MGHTNQLQVLFQLHKIIISCMEDQLLPIHNLANANSIINYNVSISDNFSGSIVALILAIMMFVAREGSPS